MIEYNATDWFYNDIERLRRYSPDWAESVYDLLDYHLLEYGGVPESCDPHPLGHDCGCLSGYMECHAEPNVLVVYKVLRGHVLFVGHCEKQIGCVPPSTAESTLFLWYSYDLSVLIRAPHSAAIAALSSSTLLVFSHGNSTSVRPKWP